MGLFDWIKKLKGEPGSEPVAAPGPAEPDLPEPRCCHYTMAHRALPQVAFQNPMGFLAVLASPDSQRFLGDLFSSVREHCATREAATDFRVEAMAVHRLKLAESYCAVIEMPPPRAYVEAYFVAVIVHPGADDGGQQAKMRYITLEKGRNLETGGSRTVLCEWTAEGSHMNHGNGPAPTVEAFVGSLGQFAAS